MKVGFPNNSYKFGNYINNCAFLGYAAESNTAQIIGACIEGNNNIRFKKVIYDNYCRTHVV